MGLINPYNGLNTAGGNLANPLGLPNGALGAPSLYFTNSATTGIYRIAANQIGFAINGFGKAELTIDYLIVHNDAAGSATLRTSGNRAGVAGDYALIDGYNEFPAISQAQIGFRRGNAADLTGQIWFRTANAAGAMIDCAVFQGLTNRLNFLNAANGAGVGAGTLLNAPAAGNPTWWLPIEINALGVKYIPCW